MSTSPIDLLDRLPCPSSPECRTGHSSSKKPALAQAGGSPDPASWSEVVGLLKQVLEGQRDLSNKMDCANNKAHQQELELTRLHGRVGVLEEFKKSHEDDAKNENAAKKQPHWMWLALGGALAMTIMQVAVGAVKAFA